ncbi:LytR/AlgR family response regulator transcription factor [Tindallia californiensis]|uniref:Stage 0 sporulation protein A homolog n=1 Tax=Tindallia californiensis TaxID=159292 RepID=A0A1H3KKJ9_9FIRM|nr:LytTR family DNA-binding domain-containing protein [Tindallia californiensis]SDY52094.1 two component transcriptional regulator, LytTR family [Tindallia californiensis]
MKILVVDDEMPARKQIAALLNEYGESNFMIEEANSGEVALNKLKNKVYDVVFLDIHLQDMSGLDVAETMVNNEVDAKIVFVTAYDEYALKAFEYAAVDYLLKPIDERRFEKTLLHLMHAYEKQSEAQLTNPLSAVEKLLIEHFKEEQRKKKLTLERDERLYVIDLEDILYIETEEGNTKVITAKGNFTSTLTLSEWEEKLPDPPFFRTHRSFLVNLEEVKEVLFWFNNALQLKIEEDSNRLIPVSRNNTKSFKERMNIIG